jgi:hypothetical protein
MPNHCAGNEFEALKLRYEDQVVLLRTLTEIDHRMVTAFFTLQLVLGGWLAAQEPLSSQLQWGIVAMDVAIAVIFLKLLFNNHRRRQEVADTIGNINEALGFNAKGAYLDGKTLNPPYKRRYWLKWYVASVVISTVGLFFVVFRY